MGGMRTQVGRPAGRLRLLRRACAPSALQRPTWRRLLRQLEAARRRLDRFDPPAARRLDASL